MGIFLSSGSFSSLALLSLAVLHAFPMFLGCGNGCSSVYLAKYSLNCWANFWFSVYVPFKCLFVPITLICPVVSDICERFVMCSSSASIPVSVIIEIGT